MTARTVPAWAGDAALGVVLAAGGGVLAAAAAKVPRGDVRSPGPGFLPLVLGVALVGLGLACAGRAWRARSAASEAVPLGDRKALACVVALAASAVLFVPLGFIPSTALFLTVLFRTLGAASWLRAAGIAGAGTAGLWLLFDRALGVQLPPGVLPL